MRNRALSFVGCLAVASAVISLTRPAVSAQAPRGTASGAPLLRTADGHPDLQGVYDVATLTPVERPAGVTPLALTNEQAAAMEQYEAQRQVKNDAPLSADRGAPP